MSHTDAVAELSIEPVRGPIVGVARVPGSKSFTNRALPIAALAAGRSTLIGPLDSEDTIVMRAALTTLGATVTESAIDPNDADAPPRWVIDGVGGAPKVHSADLFLENSGTSIRFLAAMLAACPGEWRLDGNARMRERPIADLLDALESLGIDAVSETGGGCPPIRLGTRGIAGGSVRVASHVSSQFLSGLLMAGPLASGPLRVEANGELVSKPYIEMTLATIRAFGGRLERDGDGWRSHGGGYRAAEYAIEPDASAASYLFAAAAITGGSITVPGLGSTALQGDLGFVRVLERMGCRVTQSADRTEVTGGPLVGVDVDMGDISDTVPTLAAVACFASGPTTIRHVAHIRVKETDRVAAVVTELRRAGLTVDEFPDGLRIHPGPLRPARFETYRDHRMAMSLALVGLRSPSVTILDPGCVSKTWPGFWTDLAALRQRAGV